MQKSSKPTIRQIAEATGYSKSTVSAALRNNPDIAQATRERIQKAADELGYQRDDRIAELMSYLSDHKRKAASSPIVWLNDEGERDAWKRHPWYLNIHKGAEDRAKELGYQLDDLWCREPGMTRERIVEILKARGIRGALLTRPAHNSILKDLELEFCACAQVLCDPWNERYHVAIPSHYYNVNHALEQAAKLGYQRPALTEMDSIDYDTHGLHHAAYLKRLESSESETPIPFLSYDWEDQNLIKKIKTWLSDYQPDVVLCHDCRFKEFIEKCGYSVPDDIGIIHLNLAEDVAGWTGIDPNHRVIGAAAMDIVVNQIHRNEAGRPKDAISLNIKGRWVEGSTTRRQD